MNGLQGEVIWSKNMLLQNSNSTMKNSSPKQSTDSVSGSYARVAFWAIIAFVDIGLLWDLFFNQARILVTILFFVTGA